MYLTLSFVKYINIEYRLYYDFIFFLRCLQKWKELAKRSDTVTRKVQIAIVGKYTKLEDSYASVVKSLQHAALEVGYKLDLKFIEACNLEPATRDADPTHYHEAWQVLCQSQGVVVPGGFGARGMEGKIVACNWCRLKNKPFLGICLGLQAAVIEMARNGLGLKEANTTEIDPDTPHPLVIDMPEHHTGQMGGTMRLGKRETVFRGSSVIRQLYGNPTSVEERHRHRYEINKKYVEELEKHGLHFVGTDVKEERMEIIELKDHPFYVATQYHPEYLSRPLKPSPPFLGLILASVGKLSAYLIRGCRLSPRQFSDASSSDEEIKVIKNANEALTNGKVRAITVPKINATHVPVMPAKEKVEPVS